jgi:hypothetical protein
MSEQIDLLESAQEWVHEVLGPFEGRIRAAIGAAWGRWRDRSPEELLTLDARARAAIMWCFMRDAVTEALSDVPGVHVRLHGGTCDYFVKNRVLFRLKKLNRAGRSRNFPTGSALKQYDQMELEGMEPLLRLNIGYILNATRTGIVDILVSCPFEKKVVWTYQLAAAQVASAPAIVLLPDEEQPERKRRVRVKKSAKPRDQDAGSQGD